MTDEAYYPSAERKRKKNSKEIKCRWCNKVFANRGVLVNHSRVHTDQAIIPENYNTTKVKCEVCSKEFSNSFQVKYHIRREHYNLRAKIPYYELKRINQVWYEKILNSNNIMEMKKLGNNVLVMKKMGDNTSIVVHDERYHPEIDLRSMYLKRHEVKCKYCEKSFVAKNLSKHVEEKHMNLSKHHCNNCNQSFKRLYLYTKHVCFKWKSKRKQGDLIVIDS